MLPGTQIPGASVASRSFYARLVGIVNGSEHQVFVNGYARSDAIVKVRETVHYVGCF